MNFGNYFLAFVPSFVAVDAIGMIPVYLGLTEGLSPKERSKNLQDSVLTALFVALAFLFVGKVIFVWLGVTISDFLVAGGAVLFIISIRDLLAANKSARVPGEKMGVVPLAVPLIVGPAVFATSLILLDTYGIGPAVFSIVTNVLLCGIILHFSDRLSALLGPAGSQTLSKISSLLLAAIGVMLMRRGFFNMLSG
jgi:multiple antibiotic resistance protein